MKANVQQDVLDIFEELMHQAAERRRQSENLKNLDKSATPLQPGNENNALKLASSPSVEKPDKSVDKSANVINLPVNKQPEKEESEPLNRNLKQLLAAKENLYIVRDKMSQDPEKYRDELAKLGKMESKLNVSITNAIQKEGTLAIATLKQNPERFVLLMADTKSKISDLRSQFEQEPRKYKEQLDKLDLIENKFEQKIDRYQSENLRSAMAYIQRNPEKFAERLNRFNEMQNILQNVLKTQITKEVQQPEIPAKENLTKKEELPREKSSGINNPVSPVPNRLKSEDMAQPGIPVKENLSKKEELLKSIEIHQPREKSSDKEYTRSDKQMELSR